jgi:hypothetical protein
MDDLPRKACGRCKVVQPLDDYYPDKSHRDGRHSICKACVKADRKARYEADPAKYAARFKVYREAHREQFLEYNRAVRRRALAAYGNRCACCGEDTQEFLGIDHVHNDGEAHRRELKGYGRAIYAWLAKHGYPQDGRFQVLCHNCNIAKGLYGGCPHKGAVPGRRRKPVEAKAA